MDTNYIIQQVIDQIENTDIEKTNSEQKPKRIFYTIDSLISKRYVVKSKELPLLDTHDMDESHRLRIWRKVDVDNAGDFENFGPTKYIVNLRALSSAHFAKIDREGMNSLIGMLSMSKPTNAIREPKTFSENTPCGRIMKMLETSLENITNVDTNYFTPEQKTIKNPLVRAMIKNAKIANSVPTIFGKIAVFELEGRKENQENQDQSAYINLLNLCGLRNPVTLNKKSENTRISREEFDLHVKAVMRQAEERYQMSLNSPVSSQNMLIDNERILQTTNLDPQSKAIHSQSCHFANHNCTKIDPWQSLFAIQHRGEDSVRKSYY